MENTQNLISKEGEVEEEKKSDVLEKESKDEVIEIEQNQIHPNIKNKFTSPFITEASHWDDKTQFDIPQDILKGINEGVCWGKMSRIQSVAIPLIVKQDIDKHYENLIAQAKNGSGKTGAFAIGSLLRTDPDISKLQVVVFGHTRELVIQITEVFKKIVKFAPKYKICNLLEKKHITGAQVIISTMGTFKSFVIGRDKLDLSELRVVVLDEADEYFKDQDREDDTMYLASVFKKLTQPIQYVLFSATYSEAISLKISEIVSEANQINLKKEKLKLDHIQQFYLSCNEGKKIDFVKDIIASCKQKTQTIIFVNFREFAKTLFKRLIREGYPVTLIFGGMENKERDEMIEQFRKGEATIVITTDLLSRGFDMPEIKLVINFDVPFKGNGPDFETYLHRVGRGGRWGTKALAVTLFDREQDQRNFWEIIEYFDMESSVKKLEGGAEHIGELLDEINKDALY